MCQQMVCACTNYFRAGSEKGQFRKKLFFTVNQTRIFHSLKEWAQSVPNSKLLLLCNDHLWFLEIWWTESTENNTCWGSFFSSQFSPSPHFCMWYCDCWTHVTHKCATNSVVFGFDSGFMQREFAEASRALTDSTHCLKALGWLTDWLLWIFP